MRLIDADNIAELCDIMADKCGTPTIWNQFRATVECSPTIDPVRHGRWVRLDMHKGMADHKCTSCGMEVYVPTSWGEPLYGYCPVCGAKMDEGAEDA